MIDFWSPTNYDFPKNLNFKRKIESDLYELIKVKNQIFLIIILEQNIINFN